MLLLFIDVIIMIVVDGITTLLTVVLASVPLVFALFLADVIAKMADVIAMRRLLADVLAMWLVLLPLLFVCLGRCYSLMTDAIAIFVVRFWQMLLPGG